MLRIATLLLCLLLAAASAGRYRAEVAVRDTNDKIKKIEKEQEKERRTIQMLRAELAFLESPERLAKIAEEKTLLKPLIGQQFLTTSEFINMLTGIESGSQKITHDMRAREINSSSHRDKYLVD